MLSAENSSARRVALGLLGATTLGLLVLVVRSKAKQRSSELFDHVATPERRKADDVPEEEPQREQAERKEAERKEAEHKESERKEAERKESERKEAERKEAERKEFERKESERKESERKESERKESERKEAERKEAERKETERKEAVVEHKNRSADVAKPLAAGVASFVAAESFASRPTSLRLRSAVKEVADQTTSKYWSVAGLRIGKKFLTEFEPLLDGRTLVRHPLATLSWALPNYPSFTIRLQAEDLRHHVTPLSSVDYENDCMNTVNRVFGETDSVSLVESCEASLTVVTDVFERFSQLLLYRGGIDAPDQVTVDVASYYVVKNNIGYTFTLTAPSDCPDPEGAYRDVFFTAARCAEWSPVYEEFAEARAVAKDYVAHLRPVRAGHLMHVDAPPAWECQASSPDVVLLSNPCIPSSRLAVRTTVPHGSDIRATDVILPVGDLAVLQASNVPEDVVADVHRSISVQPSPTDPTPSPRSVYVGAELSFEMPPLPHLCILARCFPEDMALVTAVSRATDADDAFEFQVSRMPVNVLTGFEEVLELIGSQVQNPEYDHRPDGSVRIRGVSGAAGVEAWVEYHLVLVANHNQGATPDVGLVRLTCSASWLARLSEAASVMASTLRFWE